MLALGVLGDQIVSRWHGRGGVHGRARVYAARGIDPVGRGGSGGEVTARSGLSAALPHLGVHGGHGNGQGRRRGSSAGLCGVGSREVVSRDGDRPLGVGVGGSDRAEGREGGVLAGFGLGLHFFPSILPDTTRVDLWQDFLAGLEKICW
jgi:hypothetical protein